MQLQALHYQQIYSNQIGIYLQMLLVDHFLSADFQRATCRWACTACSIRLRFVGGNVCKGGSFFFFLKMLYLARFRSFVPYWPYKDRTNSIVASNMSDWEAFPHLPCLIEECCSISELLKQTFCLFCLDVIRHHNLTMHALQVGHYVTYQQLHWCLAQTHPTFLIAPVFLS